MKRQGISERVYFPEITQHIWMQVKRIPDVVHHHALLFIR